MTQRYRLTQQAEQDVLGIWLHIAADNIAAADKLIDEFTVCGVNNGSGRALTYSASMSLGADSREPTSKGAVEVAGTTVRSGRAQRPRPSAAERPPSRRQCP